MNRKERRAAAKSGNAGDLHALALRLEQEGKRIEAIQKYRQALAANPRIPQAHNNLGNLLKDRGHTDEALAHYRKAVALDPTKALYCLNVAMTLAQRNEFDEAAGMCRQAIALEPHDSEAHYGLGIVLAEGGQLDEAMACYSRALDCNARHFKARVNLGLALVRQGRIVEALDQAEIVSRSSQDPTFPHYLMGVLLVRCGAAEAARVCFETYLRQDPDDREGAKLLLASLGAGPLPERASTAQLDRLYGQRATRWDETAAHGSGYLAADHVAAALTRFTTQREPLDILDAGCGTGFVGALVAARARRLIGVDASSAMLEKARRKGIYHDLQQADLVAFLNGHQQSFDAITCAATLIHFGDLRPAFAAAAAGLRDNGLFVFTLFPNEDDADKIAVEAYGGLAEGGCYRHGRNYVAGLAETSGFVVEALDLAVHEYVHGSPKMGLVGALRRIGRTRTADAAA